MITCAAVISPHIVLYLGYEFASNGVDVTLDEGCQEVASFYS